VALTKWNCGRIAEFSFVIRKRGYLGCCKYVSHFGLATYPTVDAFFDRPDARFQRRSPFLVSAALEAHRRSCAGLKDVLEPEIIPGFLIEDWVAGPSKYGKPLLYRLRLWISGDHS